MDGLCFALWNFGKKREEADLMRCRGAFAVGRLVLALTVIAATFGFVDFVARVPGSAVAVAVLDDSEHGAR